MNKIIKETVANILKVKKEDVVIIERLLGGMSHHTYHVNVNTIDYTIRIIGDDGNLFVDRYEEYENIKRVSKLNLNNETIYFDVKTGTKLALFIPGTVLSQTDPLKHLDLIAKSFKKLHTSDIKAYKPYGLVERLNKYESFNNNQTKQYYKYKEAWLKLYNKHYKNRKHVMCHNDAQTSNLVVTNNKVHILDWEYAASNDYLYDIASFGEHALELLDAYLERKANKEEIRDVNFYAMFQWLQWYQVALYKDNIGLSKTIDFDFNKLANTYMNRVIRLYNEIKDGYNEID